MKRNLAKVFWMMLIPVFTSGQDGIKIIAHRGASMNYPENTILAFDRALESGVKCIELDIRLSADDSVMVIHDETIDRTTNGRGEVGSLTFEQLRSYSAGYPSRFGQDFQGEKIPTLWEVINRFSDSCTICIDMKNVPQQKAIDLALGAEAFANIVWCSYNREKLERIRFRYPVARLSLITNLATDFDIAFAAGNAMESISTSTYTPSFYMKRAHDLGLEYWVGVVDDPCTAGFFDGLGADAIITGNTYGINSLEKNVIKCSPNPFRESVLIEFEEGVEIRSFVILNACGNLIKTISPDPGKVFWEPSGLPGGMYFIRALSHESIIFGKIIYTP